MSRPEGRSSTGPFVLDTHVWIWLMEGLCSDLSTATVSAIEEAGHGLFPLMSGRLDATDLKDARSL